MTSSQSKQVRVQLANIEPGLTVHCIDSHVVVLCLFSHTGHIAYYTVYVYTATLLLTAIHCLIYFTYFSAMTGSQQRQMTAV